MTEQTLLACVEFDLNSKLLDYVNRRYVSDRLVGGSPRTAPEYRSTVNMFSKFLGHPARLGDLAESRALQWRLWLHQQGRAAPTINKHMRTLFAIWKRAARHVSGVDKCPDRDDWRHLREPKIEPSAWRDEEIDRIIHSAATLPGRVDLPRADRLPAMVGAVPAGVFLPALLLICYSTGIRISAVMQILTADVDLDRGELLVRWGAQKQKADQRFDLGPAAVAALRRLDAHGRGLKRLFDDWPHDRRTEASWTTLNRWLKKILRDARAPEDKWLFHKFRKTFGTLCAAERGKAFAMEMLGHSSMQVTERYLDKRMLEQPRLRDVLRQPAVPETAPQLAVVG